MPAGIARYNFVPSPCSKPNNIAAPTNTAANLIIRSRCIGKVYRLPSFGARMFDQGSLRTGVSLSLRV